MARPLPSSLYNKLTPPLAIAISQAQTEQLQQELAFHSQVFDRKMKEMRAALADGTDWPMWLGVSKDAAIKVGGSVRNQVLSAIDMSCIPNFEQSLAGGAPQQPLPGMCTH